MSEVDPFLKHLKNIANDKTSKFRDALLFGRSECYSEGDTDFVDSCQEFFDRTGFLTEKQIDALFNMDGHSNWELEY